MDEPLVVPGHPSDNPSTDDFWPHLDPRLDPVFFPDDGVPAGPFSARDAKWFAMSAGDSAINDSPLIRDPLIAITDSRILVLGRPGADAPPDRRLITQFRLVCCSTIEWDLGKALSTPMLILTGMIVDRSPVTVCLVLRFSKVTDVRQLTQDVLRRAARQYLRLDLVDPGRRLGSGETEKEYVGQLAHSVIDKSERQATVPFPRFRWIRHGDDYREAGPEVRQHMVHAELSAN
ncbi:hypothetical protein CEY15_16825 [Dietzia natronolimnaea]|uniref:Uncharacterized protein n=1 Tax=Dietzia natronolimnaea TaxID=161920 RepID=A0A2A2WKS7_9ACTN|nr:hypothetical protein [Dietzia natronolimnaea]PAY21816.1 hypothetical protein CEY15_16825 [Dietzia natronolimnaea]